MEQLIIKMENQLSTYEAKLELYLTQKKGLKVINKLKRRIGEISNELRTAQVLNDVIKKHKLSRTNLIIEE
jgi:predicted DNA-binding protein YlxM (UPF0122 family)